MTIDDFASVRWVEPWYPNSAKDFFEVELQKELGPKHVLYGQEAICVGRRYDCDDALFFLPKFSHPLAVVHLTWIGKRERYSDCPSTDLYMSLEDWMEQRMKPDSLDFTVGP